MKSTEMNATANTALDANELIEAYVADVAVRLPRAQRNDVAFELRALLHEELQGKAEDAGRVVDVAMALEFLRAFGRPADVAARYRPTMTIIDPSDGRRFLFATIVGLALIWSLGLLAQWRDAAEHGLGALTMIARWWGGTVLPSLWWPGVLVAWFATSAWVHRRWPRTSHWTPRSAHHIAGGRGAMAMGVIGMLCGMTILIEPRWILDIVWSGHAAPAAYTALTYTDTFVRGPAFVLLALIALNVPLYIAVMANGRWSPRLRRIETVHGLILCAAMLWAIVDGPIFLSTRSDATAKTLMALIVAYMLLHCAIAAYRRVRPTPKMQILR